MRECSIVTGNSFRCGNGAGVCKLSVLLDFAFIFERYFGFNAIKFLGEPELLFNVIRIVAGQHFGLIPVPQNHLFLPTILT